MRSPRSRSGPDAPTLCEGWQTHDLAAHLWIRETDPIGAGGMVAKPLAGLLERRMADVKQRWEFAELVDRIRNGPARFSVFALPGRGRAGQRHRVLRPPRGRPPGRASIRRPRGISAQETEDFIWRRLKLLGRAFFRRAPVGVVLERLGTADAYEPDTIRAVSGTPIVTIVGQPSELLLFAQGRTSVAEVKLIGEPDAIDLLNGTDLRPESSEPRRQVVHDGQTVSVNAHASARDRLDVPVVAPPLAVLAAGCGPRPRRPSRRADTRTAAAEQRAERLGRGWRRWSAD